MVMPCTDVSNLKASVLLAFKAPALSRSIQAAPRGSLSLRASHSEPPPCLQPCYFEAPPATSNPQHPSLHPQNLTYSHQGLQPCHQNLPAASLQPQTSEPRPPSLEPINLQSSSLVTSKPTSPQLPTSYLRASSLRISNLLTSKHPAL